MDRRHSLSSLAPVAWGNTIALSWTWGLGLFFSVQFTVLFGLAGLLAFAIPNGIGLFLFGLITQKMAERGSGNEALADYFAKWSRPFGLPLLLYQVAALSLTIFAFINYFLRPLGLEPELLFLPLGLLVILAVTFFVGQEFNISRIKWSHSVLLIVALLAIVVIAIGFRPNPFPSGVPFTGLEPFQAGTFLGYLVPISVGLLVGPWMDLQHWQRAVEIRREGHSATTAYAIGSTLFFLILLIHGGLTNWALSQGADQFIRTGLVDFAYGHQILTEFFHGQAETNPLGFAAYGVFVCVCILTTLDSGYIALRWHFESTLASGKGILQSLVPKSLLTSPIPVFLLCAVIAVAGVGAGLELEYFMILYGSFFVVYSTLAMIQTIKGEAEYPFEPLKMFCIGVILLVMVSFGYLQSVPLLMVAGALLPVGYVAWMWCRNPSTAPASGTGTPSRDEPSPAQSTPEPLAKAESPAPATTPVATTVVAGDGPSIGHFEGKRFVHTFIATYSDTNSVGNVYFGMYGMWVGKTRELFFNQVLPNFDLKTTDYYILTRSFEHKYMMESREFDTIRIELTVGDSNRKFSTLEHRVLNGDKKVLGKGKQTLMFVSSNDYSLVDIPMEVQLAFVPYAPEGAFEALHGGRSPAEFS